MNLRTFIPDFLFKHHVTLSPNRPKDRARAQVAVEAETATRSRADLVAETEVSRRVEVGVGTD